MSCTWFEPFSASQQGLRSHSKSCTSHLNKRQKDHDDPSSGSYFWPRLTWKSLEYFLPGEQSTCHAQQTLPVLAQVCHDNNDVSSHSDLVQGCLHHVRKTRSHAGSERPACNRGGIRSFLVACENPKKFQAQLHNFFFV